jgi:hypothetical protein
MLNYNYYEKKEKINELIVENFCKAWNNLDTNYLQGYLNKDFVYSSQMVMDDINGSDNYLNYLMGKFIAIKESNNRVTAEIGYWNSSPCLILIQHLENSEREVYNEHKKMSDGTIEITPIYTNERGAVITFEFDDNKVKSAIMCVVIPTINQVKRTGVFPT